MFARFFNVNLKAGAAPEYARTVHREVLPILRKSAGFRDEMTVISSDGKRAIGISFWDRQEDADAYARAAYHDVFTALQEHMDGAPVVRTYDVAHSTAYAIVPALLVEIGA